jgi:transcriptional regulator with XRE-family HTH domain
MANKQFGDTLRDLRNNKGYTQQQAATLLGLKNKSTLGSWEVGKSEPDGYTLLKLLKLYEVEDVYEAFGEISPKPFQNDNIKEIIENYDQTSENSNIDGIHRKAIFKLGKMSDEQVKAVLAFMDSLEKIESYFKKRGD